MPGLPSLTSSAPSDRGDTSAAPNGRAEDGVPETGGDAEIAAVAIVMRHVPHPRPIENVFGLNCEMMRRVMHEHIEGVTEQHAAGHAAGCDEAVLAQRKKDWRDDPARRDRQAVNDTPRDVVGRSGRRFPQGHGLDGGDAAGGAGGRRRLISAGAASRPSERGGRVRLGLQVLEALGFRGSLGRPAIGQPTVTR